MDGLTQIGITGSKLDITDVETAVAVIEVAGQEPTIERVRWVLGGNGKSKYSRTTVGGLLKSVRALSRSSNSLSDVLDVPEPVVIAFKSVWKAALGEAGIAEADLLDQLARERKRNAELEVQLQIAVSKAVQSASVEDQPAAGVFDSELAAQCRDLMRRVQELEGVNSELARSLNGHESELLKMQSEYQEKLSKNSAEWRECEKRWMDERNSLLAAAAQSKEVADKSLKRVELDLQRWMLEVDDARQAAKKWETRYHSEIKSLRSELLLTSKQLEASQRENSRLEQKLMNNQG